MEPARNVGGKIMQIRQLKNISIADLSERCQLDQQQIELIESNELLPSLAPLIKIARALGVRLGTFLDDQEKLGPLLTRAGEEKVGSSFSNKNSNSHTHLNFYPLANGKSGRHMEPFIIHIQQKDAPNYQLSSHEGEEFIYVLEGTVEISYGKENYVLNPGDSIYYDSIVEHHVHAGQTSCAKILAVVYTPV
jgi:transcriptional regulator with XRE-family HTH domain